MMRAFLVAVIVVASLVLGATVFREQIALAAQVVDATIIGPLDAGGNVRVREQAVTQLLGTAALTGNGNDLTIDASAFKTIRVAVSGMSCGGAGESSNFTIIAMEENKVWAIDRIDFCTATGGLQSELVRARLRDAYDTPGRVLNFHVGGGGNIEIAVFGRTN
jgi:hypothetical protein